MSLVEKFVTQWLPEAEVDFLTQLCTEYAIQIPPAKAGKHQDILKLVLRHLSSQDLEDTADHGAAVYLKLFNELGTVLGKGQPKPEPALSTNGDNDSTITYHKLRMEILDP